MGRRDVRFVDEELLLGLFSEETSGAACEKLMPYSLADVTFRNSISEDGETCHSVETG